MRSNKLRTIAMTMTESFHSYAQSCRRPALALLLALVPSAGASAFTAPAATGPGLGDTAWPDYGGGYLNQHRSRYAGPSSTFVKKWEFDLAVIPTREFKRGYHQPILLADGTLVLNLADSSDDQIVALTPQGTLRWRVDDSSLGPWLAVDAQDQIYTIASIYGGFASGRVRAVTSAGGNLWVRGLSGSHPTQNGPAIGRDGAIYAAVDFSPLAAFSPAGAPAWTSAPSGYYVNPAIAADGTIIVGGNNLTALAPNGAVLWQKPARVPPSGGNASYLSPAIGDDGVIYAGQLNALNLVAVDPSGAELWARPDLGGAPAVGFNNDVYVVPETGILHALNAADGSTRWTYATGKTDYYNSEGVTIDRLGNLYVCSDQGVLTSLTPDGQFRWSYDFAPADNGFIGTSAPVIDDNGVLYVVGGNTGKVFALQLAPEPSALFLAVVAAAALGRVARKSRGW
jgi:outer membrane protein assembly factor BamB